MRRIRVYRVTKAVGIALMVFSLLMNPLILSWLFGPDRCFDSLFVNQVIVLVECVFFFLGLCVCSKPNFFIKKRKELLLSLVTFFVCMFFFEFAVRIFWDEPVRAGYGYPEGLHVPDDMTGYKYKPLFVGNFPGELYRDVEIRINSKGLRDYEHNYRKPTGKIRVLGLGDSIAFGSGVDYEDTYLRQLEKKLLDNGYDVEIIKAGVNSFEFDQEYAYYFEEGYKYDPDIVLIGVYVNDVKMVDPIELKEKMFQDNARENSSIVADLRRIVPKYFKSIRFIYRSIISILPDKSKSKTDNEIYFDRVYGLWNDNASWDNYKVKLLGLYESLKQDNIRLILLYFPNTLQFTDSPNFGVCPQEKILNLSLDNGITFIDMTPHLDLSNYGEYYLFSDNCHLNGKGYKIVSDVMYEVFVEEDLIKNVA